MKESSVYKVIFVNQGSVYEIYAKYVEQSEFLGFIEIESLIFNTHTAVLVDPAEEKLKNEFTGVKRVFIPIQSIIRIDEVDKEGACKIKEMGTKGENVTPFPGQSPFFNTKTPPKTTN